LGAEAASGVQNTVEATPRAGFGGWCTWVVYIPPMNRFQPDLQSRTAVAMRLFDSGIETIVLQALSSSGRDRRPSR
jgi:hypothetical protein